MEYNPGVAARGGHNLVDIELLEHLFATGCLLALGHIGTKAADKFFELLALLFVLFILLLLLAESQLAGLVPEGVVPGKLAHLTKVYVYGVGGNGVEEVTVVAYNEYGTLCFCKIIFEPSYGIEVEVVGRFVQQKVVGFTKESTSE